MVKKGDEEVNKWTEEKMGKEKVLRKWGSEGREEQMN